MSTNQEAFNFEIETFQGESLNPPVKVTGSASQYTDVASARDAGVWPNEATVLEWLNADELAKAKSNARATALKSHMEAYQASPAFKIKQAVKALVELGYSREQAEAMSALQK